MPLWIPNRKARSSSSSVRIGIFSPGNHLICPESLGNFLSTRLTSDKTAQTSPGFASRPPNPAQPQKGIMGQPRPMLQRPGVTCFKCGQPGHYSNACPQQKLPPPPPRPNTNQAMVRASPPKAFNTNNRPVGKAARVNHVKVDKAEEAPDVVLGTLPVNSIPAKVLFDTGASHSFV